MTKVRPTGRTLNRLELGPRRKEEVKMSPGFLGQALWKDDPGVEMGTQGGSDGNGKATCAVGPLILGARFVEVY